MQNTSFRTFFMVGFLMVAVCVFLFFVKAIILPFLLAGFFAYLLSPIILKLQSAGFKRQVSVFVLFIAFLIVFSATVYFLFTAVAVDVYALKSKMPEYSQKIKSSFYILEQEIENKLPFAQKAIFVDDVEQRISIYIN